MAIPAFLPLSPRRPFPAKAWLDHQHELAAARAGNAPAQAKPLGKEAHHPAPEAHPARPRRKGWLRVLLDRLRLYRSNAGNAIPHPSWRAADGTSPRPGRSGDQQYAPRPQADARLHAGRSAETPLLSGGTLDLAMLLSCLPETLRGGLLAQARPLLALYDPQHPQGGVSAALRLGAPPTDRLGRLRGLLLLELTAGLALAATPLKLLSRPLRNPALVARAETIGRLAGELARCPGADPLEQELVRLLDRLKRRS